MDTLQWAIGILVTVNTAVLGFLAKMQIAHERECRQASSRIASLEVDLERMKEDIGTHDSGMRGAIHKTANIATRLEMKIAALERK